jgi:hypothetical protein
MDTAPSAITHALLVQEQLQIALFVLPIEFGMEYLAYVQEAPMMMGFIRYVRAVPQHVLLAMVGFQALVLAVFQPNIVI